jgi:hypothetical protein
MASLQKSSSGDINLFCVDQAFTKSADPCPMPIAVIDSPLRARGYYSIQLAVVIGLFACGGFLCSLFFVDGDDDFPRPHHWLGKLYSSPVMTLPPAPSEARVFPQNILRRPNQVEKTAVSQQHWVSHRKLTSSPRRTGSPTFDFRPLIGLRTKWTNFSGNLRDRGIPFNFARNLALDFGRRLRQHHFEAGRFSAPEDTDRNTHDAG